MLKTYQVPRKVPLDLWRALWHLGGVLQVWTVQRLPLLQRDQVLNRCHSNWKPTLNDVVRLQHFEADGDLTAGGLVTASQRREMSANRNPSRASARFSSGQTFRFLWGGGAVRRLCREVRTDWEWMTHRKRSGVDSNSGASSGRRMFPTMLHQLF